MISSTPGAGTVVFVGDPVGLEISLGSLKPVPDVVGETLSDATTTITLEGFTVGVVTVVFHATIPQGQLLSQTPSFGNSLISWWCH